MYATRQDFPPSKQISTQHTPNLHSSTSPSSLTSPSSARGCPAAATSASACASPSRTRSLSSSALRSFVPCSSSPDAASSPPPSSSRCSLPPSNRGRLFSFPSLDTPFTRPVGCPFVVACPSSSALSLFAPAAELALLCLRSLPPVGGGTKAGEAPPPLRFPRS